MDLKHRDSLIVFGVALAVRLAYLAQIAGSPLERFLIGDAAVYDEWARRIAGGDWLGDQVFYQAPLYPYLLGAVYAIVGPNVLAVRITQAVIGSTACVLLTGAARRYFDRPIALAAGLGLALYPAAFFSELLIEKSAVDLLLVCGLLNIISRFGVDRPAHGAWWLLVGVVGGALMLTRENAMVMIGVMLAWLLLDRGLGPMKQRLRRAALMTAGATLLLGPVAIRNWTVGGELHLTTPKVGVMLYLGNNPRATGSYVPLRHGRGQVTLEREDAAQIAEERVGRSLSPREVSAYWLRQTLDYIRAAPGHWLGLLGTKAMLTINRVETVSTEDQYTYAEFSPVLRWTTPVFHMGVLAPLAALGIAITWPARGRLGVLYALTAGYILTLVVFYVFARYRLPFVPMFMLFAAAGVVELCRRLTAPALRRSVAVPAAIAAIVALPANWPVVPWSAMRATGLVNLGAILDTRMNDRAGAIDAYRRALALSPASEEIHYQLGAALAQADQVEEARQRLETAVRLGPDFADAHARLGLLYADAGETGRARQCFERAIALDPKHAAAHNNLGLLLASQGESAAAIEQFRLAVAADDQYAPGHLNLGSMLMRAGRFAEAVEHYRRYVALRPDDVVGRRALDNALTQLRERQPPK